MASAERQSPVGRIRAMLTHHPWLKQVPIHPCEGGRGRHYERGCETARRCFCFRFPISDRHVLACFDRGIQKKMALRSVRHHRSPSGPAVPNLSRPPFLPTTTTNAASFVSKSSSLSPASCRFCENDFFFFHERKCTFPFAHFVTLFLCVSWFPRSHCTIVFRTPFASTHTKHSATNQQRSKKKAHAHTLTH